MKNIDRQVAIARTGEFVDEIAHGVQGITPNFVVFDRQCFAQLFEQPGVRAFSQRVGDDGVSRELKAVGTVHVFLCATMPRQTHRGEASAANTVPPPVFAA